jgi:hypothetical protein
MVLRTETIRSGLTQIVNKAGSNVARYYERGR